ncbi:MAG: DUF1919 domain-containing protein [Selenomonadaceae bacterium]|nr:DUF1919 domain-containing protein [Selenomonadaceae bacterium]
MLKILLWFVSKDTYCLETSLNILDGQHGDIELVGTVTGEEIFSLDCRACDVVLVVGARKIGVSKIVGAARQLNVPEEKILCDCIVPLPGFALDKYRRLQRSRLSVVSMNCFGGFISHMLGLPFRSPFVNLWLSEKDFLKFLHAPKFYLETKPRFERLDHPWELFPNGYPIVSLDDVTLNMMHYKTFEESVDAWNRRKARINRYNLLVTMYTESEDILREFDALPYGKKVCFVPFKSDADSAWYINPNVDADAKNFTEVVNRFSCGHYIYFDLFDMLLYGKKTPAIEM